MRSHSILVKLLCEQGDTSLIRAIYFDNLQVAELLIGAKADVNANNVSRILCLWPVSISVATEIATIAYWWLCFACVVSM